jgi:hypothetical protein
LSGLNNSSTDAEDSAPDCQASGAPGKPPTRKSRLIWLLPPVLLIAGAIFFWLYVALAARGESVEDLLAARGFLFLAHVSLIAAIAAVLLLLLRTWRPNIYRVALRWLERAALLLASLAVALIIAEILTRLFVEEQLVQLELQNLHRISQSENILYELRPGASLRFFYEAQNEWIEYKINSLGFREHETPLQKPPHTFRILVVGDSVSFGIRVNQPYVFSERLEHYLNARKSNPALTFEVINASVCGWNTFNEVSFIAERGINLQPDLIILQFHPNDLDNPTGHLGTTAVYHFRHMPDEYFPNPNVPERTQNIFTRTARQFSIVEVAKWFGKKHSKFVRFFIRRYLIWQAATQAKTNTQLSKWFSNCLWIIYKQKSPEWDWLKRRCEDLRRITQERAIPVVVLIPPLSYQLNSKEDYEKESPRVLAALFAQYGFKPLDLTPSFALASYDDQFFYYLREDASHWNKWGHNMVAEALCDFLRNEKLVPD